MARTTNLKDFLTDVASAIKAKTGMSSSSKIYPSNFDNLIRGIKAGVAPQTNFYSVNSSNKGGEYVMPTGYLLDQDLSFDIPQAHRASSAYPADTDNYQTIGAFKMNNNMWTILAIGRFTGLDHWKTQPSGMYFRWIFKIDSTGQIIGSMDCIDDYTITYSGYGSEYLITLTDGYLTIQVPGGEVMFIEAQYGDACDPGTFVITKYQG